MITSTDKFCNISVCDVKHQLDLHLVSLDLHLVSLEQKKTASLQHIKETHISPNEKVT